MFDDDQGLEVGPQQPLHKRHAHIRVGVLQKKVSGSYKTRFQGPTKHGAKVLQNKASGSYKAMCQGPTILGVRVLQNKVSGSYKTRCQDPTKQGIRVLHTITRTKTLA